MRRERRICNIHINIRTLGLFNFLVLFAPAADLLVILVFAATKPPLAVRGFVNVLLAVIFKGALHAAGLARTCPLRGPYGHLNLRLGLFPGRL